MALSSPFVLAVAGREIHGLVDSPDPQTALPTVVICHGFKGFMEWGFFPPLAALLAARGFCVVRFNFSGSGMRPGDELVTDPDAFSTATFSQDLAELRAVVGALGDSIGSSTVDPERLALLGHSRGGGIALLAAADLPVRALVTWAAVATFERFSAAETAAWREAGRVPVVNARTGQELELDRVVLDDLEANRGRLDLEAAAARRRAPWLLLHGNRDETVAPAEARRLHAAAAEPVRCDEIADGDHTFGARHPFAGPTPQLTAAMNATQGFLRRHL